MVVRVSPRSGIATGAALLAVAFPAFVIAAMKTSAASRSIQIGQAMARRSDPGVFRAPPPGEVWTPVQVFHPTLANFARPAAIAAVMLLAGCAWAWWREGYRDGLAAAAGTTLCSTMLLAAA